MELERRRHEHRRAGYKPPQYQYPRKSKACAHTLEQEIARHFEEDVADKKYPDAEAEGRGAHVETLAEFVPGIADIHAVDVVEDVAEKEKRDESARDFFIKELFSEDFGIHRREFFSGHVFRCCRHGESPPRTRLP